jgi:hypothetical protein
VEFALFSIVWIAGWIATSILYRRRLRKPLFPRVPDSADFAETWRSGRSLKNFLTRIGGASNCLLVYVDNGTLTIVPMFPFNLMFLPEIYGLEIVAPVDAVRLAETDGLLRKRVVLSVDGPREQRFEISLRDLEAFRRSLEGKRRSRSKPS